MSHHNPLPNITLPGPASAGEWDPQCSQIQDLASSCSLGGWIILSCFTQQQLQVRVTPAWARGVDIGLHGLAQHPLPGLRGEQV